MHRPVVVPLAWVMLAATLALTSCATADSTGGAAPAGTTGQGSPTDLTGSADPTGPTATTGSTSPAPTTTEYPEDLPSPSGRAGKGSTSRTLRGRVEPGVEGGCLLLDGYLLLGGPRDVLKAGRTVSVTGRPVPDQLTTCQQGIPFQVERAS